MESRMTVKDEGRLWGGEIEPKEKRTHGHKGKEV